MPRQRCVVIVQLYSTIGLPHTRTHSSSTRAFAFDDLRIILGEALERDVELRLLLLQPLQSLELRRSFLLYALVSLCTLM